MLFRTGSRCFANQRRIHNPSFLLPSTLDEYGKQLLAEDAYYQPPTVRPAPAATCWSNLLSHKDLAQKPSLKLGDRTVVYTPFDSPGLKPDQCFIASDVNSRTTRRRQQIGGSILRRSTWCGGPQQPQASILERTCAWPFMPASMQPLLDITLLFLGLPLILASAGKPQCVPGDRPVRAAGAGAFMLIVIACQYLGDTYLVNPALAAWLPLMIFCAKCASAMSNPLRE